MRFLDTPRLYLRPFSAEDHFPLHRITGNPEVMRYSVFGADRDVDATGRRLAGIMEQQQESGLGCWAVVSRTTGDLLGMCGLAPLSDGRTEIAYAVRRDQWGNGYATEAARRWLEHALDTLKLGSVIAMIGPDNLRSLRVAEKLGMRHVGSERHFGGPLGIYAAGDPARSGLVRTLGLAA